jgi:hypothetical protein
VYICHIVFVHSSGNAILDCFHVLAIVKKCYESAYRNMSSRFCFTFFFDYIVRNGVPGFHGNSISVLSKKPLLCIS